LALRGRLFPSPLASDQDRFDADARHLLIEEAGSGALVAAARLMVFASSRGLAQGYAGERYDLAPLASLAGPVAELGRFCIAHEARDGEALRLAWGALTRVVDAEGISFLCGCASFAGADPARHAPGLAWLATRALGPEALRPGRAGLPCHALAEAAGPGDPAALPPLLRSYLAMGGWVSDHAVIDRALDTLHVFTGVEIARVPPARARALRSLAAVG
jgi:putative hemolysin